MNRRFELPFGEMEDFRKISFGVETYGNQELSSEQVKFEIPLRHPGGDTE